MTFRAILDDGKEHKPVFLMLTGQMTPRQIDKEYRKKCGLCPDCEDFFASNDQGDGGTYAAAMANKDRSVAYRRGYYMPGTDDLLTQMHFAHKKGYLLSGLAPCSRCTLRQLIHKEAVEAIAHQYRKDMPKGFRVDAECQFVKPGTPPETYRPDIVVFNQFGGKHTCIEYQRSAEAFESFVHRHELRGSEWGNVIWFFDERIWERSTTCEARDWLFDNGQTFYKCWVDERTMQLQVEEGTFATAVVKKAKGKRKLKRFVPKACSVADIVNEYLLATGQEVDTRGERRREQKEPPKADRLQGFNLVEKSEADRNANRELFETLKRQKAQREEEDRRRREYGARMNRLEAIEVQSINFAIIGDEAETKADKTWSLEQLDAELERLNALRPRVEELRAEQRVREAIAAEQARLAEISSVLSNEARISDAALDAAEQDGELDELYADWLIRKPLIAKVLAAVPGVNEDDLYELADCELERKLADHYSEVEAERLRAEAEREAAREQAALRRRIEEQRLREEAQRRREAIAAEERKWRQIEARPELIRGQQVMATPLRIGDRLRRGWGSTEAVYQGVTGAGFTTTAGTYDSLIGWQVFQEETN